ncbi:major histocompatibility complex class I-related gene protein isoform X1 [Xenopus tropicalis]|uniref:Major histocompatibility complex class I-related gene protein isoform X1 n=1 Tax=Xenopus tropicalis TaxID=8364 RepID=A0A8J0QVJ0_XENTR|nr:major histocompatibility complex class I-related gene protein isoform X1 [Xenopus tropicalis]|eukprot:XP_002938998.1 PREDICTED: major histocompatibility complex class I-related gene protein-like [Xenopus tropicalis]
MMYIVVLLFSLGVCAVHCGSHTLEYHIALVSSPAPGVPQSTITVYIDGLKYGKYDSETRRARFLTPSLSSLTEHLDMQTKYAQRFEVIQKHKMAFLTGYLNRTYGNGDFHVYQRRFACELHEDGTVSGYEEIAYNGKEVMMFDKERVVYVPVTQEVLTMTQQWNQHYNDAKINKIYMENECIHYMKMYLPYISTDLERKVHPEVKVSSSESVSGTKLHCRVYGFYPRDVDVKWIKNERDEIYSEEAAQILPNPDGTYQIRVSVEVTPEEGATYSCHVDHSSLAKPLAVCFEPSDRLIVYIMVAVAAVLSFTLVALGIFAYKARKKKGLNKMTEIAFGKATTLPVTH